jgi:hypothetical protein
MSVGSGFDEPMDERQPTIDDAIESCRANISRHTKAPLIELLAALILAVLIVASLLLLGKLELEHRNNSMTNAYVLLAPILAETGGRLQLLEKKLAQTERTIDSNGNPDYLKRLAEKKKELVAELEALREKDLEIRNRGMSIQAKRAETPILAEHLIYGAGAILILIIALLVGIYRMHLTEISKNEQFKLALHRIRIAANNAHSPGFDSEVRCALTQDAFSVYVEEKSWFTRRKIESPVRGLPSSDLATSIINRILDEVDIVVQPKKGRDNN